MSIPHIAGFIPASRCYVVPDQEGCFAFKNYADDSLLAKISIAALRQTAVPSYCQGYVLWSQQQEARLWRHSLNSALGCSAELATFSTDGEVSAFRFVDTGEQRYFVALQGVNQALFIYETNGEHTVQQQSVLQLGSRPIRKFEAIIQNGRLLLYVLFEAGPRGSGELVEYAVELGEKMAYRPAYVKSTQNVFDVCVVGNREAILLTSNDLKNTFQLGQMDTNIPINPNIPVWLSEVTVVDARHAKNGVPRSCPTTYGIVHQEDNICTSAFVWQDRVYPVEHPAARFELDYHHQEIIIEDFTIEHTLYSINRLGQLLRRDRCIELFSEAEKQIVESIDKVFNREGQLDLFFEKPLRQVLALQNQFESFEECSFTMFKFLINRHLEAFMRSLFLPENKDLNSHSNFQRYNQFVHRYVAEMQAELLRRLRTQDTAEASITDLLQSAERVFYFARGMHIKIESEEQRYLKYRSVGDRRQSRYSKSVAKYLDTKNISQSLVFVLSFVCKATTNERLELNRLVSMRISAIRELEYSQSGNARNVVYFQQYFREFGEEYWTSLSAAFNGFDFFSRLVKSHPFEVLYLLVGTVPLSKDCKDYFGIGREELDAVNAARKLEDRQQSKITHVQCLDHLSNVTCCVPDYLSLYLSKAALSRQLNAVAVRILQNGGIRFSKKNMRDIVDIYIRAHKVELCYLQIKDFLAEVVGEQCSKTSEDFDVKEAIKLLIERCLEQGAVMEIVRLVPGLEKDERDLLDLELERRSIRVNLADYAQLDSCM